ncbi:unnamed protein product [Protopolystoma xenopodis]|uniref:Urocanase N-terminal domain-containing protein n=1 Tax=Protopolystoma xenopodis TaxID=117903 RepID=A0A448WW21_9PLAT|nr:unnamed protein product [Protopolystoma xenopodis]
MVTYGGNGQVFSNWAQFWLVMQALSRLTKELTLILYSGHPLGLFPSPTSAPRLVITNGMLVPKAGQEAGYNRLFALGVSQYGQMTAGSYCYIGPQGIVHGTTLTLLNALRKKNREDQSSQGMSRETRSSEGCENANSPGWGKVFITSGLGGMSGAQASMNYIL